jgi:hypothetical protein
MRLVAALLAAAALLVGGLIVPAPSRGAAFIDTSGHMFAGDIEWAATEGITGGCGGGRYCPDAAVTRAQMASFISRMFELPASSADAFTDDEGSMHEADINRVAAAGIAGGCTTTTYCPSRQVTRAEMTSFLARAMALSAGAGNDYFNDDNGTTHESNIDRAAAAGIASGCGEWRFCPAKGVTRGQMAAFLRRVVDPVPSPAFPAPPPATPKPAPAPTTGCDASYPGVCIKPPPPDLDCADIPYRRFTVRAPDPHNFDGDYDGIGCESG